VQQYAAEHLQQRPDEEQQTRRAHAAWFTALAAESAPHLHGPDQAQWLTRLQNEHDNLRATLAWILAEGDAPQALALTVALHWFWYVRGHHHEGRSGLAAALALPSGAEVAAGLMSVRAAALSRAGGLARDLGDSVLARRWQEEALELARQGGWPALEAEALHGLGLSCREQGQLDEARHLLQQAETLQRGLQEPWGLATTLNDLGIVFALHGGSGQNGALPDHLERARQLFAESLVLKQNIGDRQGVAYALANLGNVTKDLGEFQRLTEQSLEIKRELGDRQGVANSLYNLADLHLNRGELAAARRQLGEALELYWQLGRTRSIVAALMSFARLSSAEGDSETCLTLAGAAESLRQRADFTTPGIQIDDVLAQAHAQTEAAGADLFRRGQAMPLEQVVTLAQQGRTAFLRDSDAVQSGQKLAGAQFPPL
jgi:tetratricopeptide (TPR) repeat protein